MWKWTAVLLPLALISLCLSPCVPHELKLRQMKREFAAVQHPPDSRSVLRASEVGLLEGNGNHCDYFVGEVRITRLSPSELRAFYGPKMTVECATESDGSQMKIALLDRADPEPISAGERKCVISLWDQEGPGFDMRCH